MGVDRFCGGWRERPAERSKAFLLFRLATRSPQKQVLRLRLRMTSSNVGVHLVVTRVREALIKCQLAEASGPSGAKAPVFAGLLCTG